MHRRLALCLVAVALLGLLAGCSAAGSIDMEPVNDTELADGASRSLDPGIPARDPSERPPSAVARAAIENGSTTVTAVSPPVDRGLPYAHEGAYYDLSWTVVGEESASAVSIRINASAADESGDGVGDGDRGGDATTIAYEELPAPDRDALAALVSAEPPSPFADPEGDDETAAVGVHAVYTDAELNASVLAPDQQYDAVVVDGERYALTVEEPRSTTVRTYRYEATTVAPNATAYADRLRDASEFTLSGLSDGERSVVEEATGDGSYYADSTDDGDFEALLDRFRDREAVERDSASGTWLVRYDGQLYLADLTFGGFLDE